LVGLVEWWAGLLLVVMVALVTVGVGFRYVLDSSLSWYDEFASYLLVWLSFYGAVGATYRQRHICFEVLAERAPAAVGRAMAIASEVGSIAFESVLCGYGVVLLRTMANETAVSIPAVPMVLVYSALPISGGLMLVVSVVRLVGIVRGERGGGRPEAAALSTMSTE